MQCVIMAGMIMIKRYSELIRLETFNERFEYLKLNGSIGHETFGSRRYLNQTLYSSKEWRNFRNEIILRDEGRDLACKGYDIFGQVYIHHLNPITIEDIQNRDPKIFDFENVVCVSFNTHNAIHYGDEIRSSINERKQGDTLLW